MRQRFFLFLMAVAAMTVAGCSSEDDTTAYPDSFTNIEQTMTFRLLDGNMKETNIFKEDENIVFDFVIENNSENVFSLKRNFDGGDIILSNDFFSVYTEKGEYVGVPWTGIFCEESLQDTWTYAPHTIWHITCSWYANNSYGYSSHPFCGGHEGDTHRRFLVRGRYYAKFHVKYNANVGQQPATMKDHDFIIHFEIV